MKGGLLFKMAKKRKASNVKISRVEKLLNTGFLLSIGIASITKEKVEKLVMALVKKGKLNESQGRKMVRDVLAKARKEKARVSKIIKG